MKDKSHEYEEVTQDEILVKKARQTSKDLQQRKCEPPDGGWSWIFLVSYSMIALLSPLVGTLFGMLFAHMVDRLELSSVLVAWIFNIHQLSWSFAGVIVGPLSEEFRWRTIAVWGSLIASLSIILASFINQLYFFLINAVVYGFGSGLTFNVGQLMIPHYFDKRRGLAVSVTASSTSIGQFILPIYIRLLQEHYGAVGATQIFAVTLANCIVAAMFFHPVEWHQKNRVRVVQKSSPNPPESAFLRALANVWDSVSKAFIGLKSPDVLILSISSAVFLVCYFNFMLMLPFTVMEKGHSMQTAANCISVCGLSNVAARLLIGPLTDMFNFKRTIPFFLGQFILCVSILAYTFTCEMVWMLTSLVVLGFSIGTVISLQMLVLLELKGLDNLATTYSSFSIINMILYVLLGPFIGLVRDLTNSYTISCRILSGLVLFDILLWLLMPSTKNDERNVNSKT